MNKAKAESSDDSSKSDQETSSSEKQLNSKLPWQGEYFKGLPIGESDQNASKVAKKRGNIKASSKSTARKMTEGIKSTAISSEKKTKTKPTLQDRV